MSHFGTSAHNIYNILYNYIVYYIEYYIYIVYYILYIVYYIYIRNIKRLIVTVRNRKDISTQSFDFRTIIYIEFVESTIQSAIFQ